jgi:hypothetical protein
VLVVQDGHQTHTRASDAIEEGYVSGVIWSPGDHSPERLAERIQSEPFVGTVQAIDPQLYVARLDDANPKKLGLHELFDIPLRPRDLAGRKLAPLVDDVLSSQAAHSDLTHLIAPTVAFGALGDRNAQTAIDLADASVAWWDDNEDEDRPLLTSLAIEHTLLADQESVDGLLDEITSLDTHGFYLLFELDPNADPTRAAPAIYRALYIVNTLADNDFDVWVGYAGLGGYAMRAAGASTVATGLFQKQQWWSPGHWTRGGGGRQPKPRAYLSTVSGSLLIEAELGVLKRVSRGLFDEAVDAPGPIAADLRGGRSPSEVYDRAECSMQLFATLAEFEERIGSDLESNLRQVHRDLQQGMQRLELINDAVVLDVRSGTRAVGSWLDAVAQLGADLGIDL